jgi:hypothetical protein
LQHGAGTDTIGAFLLRLEYRVRYYRFFFLPPLYLALVGFVGVMPRWWWVAATLGIFALGTNLFPYLLLHYLAGVAGLFVLMSVVGLRRLSEWRMGAEIAFVLVVLCGAEFLGWYGLHLFERPQLYPLLRYETWDSINHEGQARKRVQVNDELAEIPGELLVFVRYSARHIYQEEWVWNGADIDGQRIVFARDLGTDEDQKLIRYYSNRKVLVLEPDGVEAKLSAWQ